VLLIPPSLDYQASYIDYINELGHEERYPFVLDFLYQDFCGLLKKLANYAQGINIPQDSVPSSTFWLVEGNELVGVTNIRHCLNPRIAYCGGHVGLGIRPSCRGKGLGKLLMKLSIEKLVEFGVKPIHIHCHKENSASAKVITDNGGVLASEICENNRIIERYQLTY
jgi:predicted acetyltransferase